MALVQFCRHSLGGNSCRAVETISVQVPFLHAVHEELPKDNAKPQWSIREDTGQAPEKLPHETLGWTVEYHAPVECEWADFWVTATCRKQLPVEYEEGGKLRIEREERSLPAMNLALAEAMSLAVQMKMLRGREDGKFRMGTIRLRHQHSGNVIIADIL